MNNNPRHEYQIAKAILPFVGNNEHLAQKQVDGCNQLIEFGARNSGTVDATVTPDQLCAVALFALEYEASMRGKTPFFLTNKILRGGNPGEISQIADYLLFLLTALSHFQQARPAEQLYSVISLDDFSGIEQQLMVNRVFTCREFMRLYTEKDAQDLSAEIRRPLVFRVVVGDYAVYDISEYSLGLERALVMAPGAKLKVTSISPGNVSVVDVQVCEMPPQPQPLSAGARQQFERRIARPFRECLSSANFWGTTEVPRQCDTLYQCKQLEIHSRHMISRDEALAVIAVGLDYGAALAHKEPFVVLNKALEASHLQFPDGLRPFVRLLAKGLMRVRAKSTPNAVYRAKRARDIDFGSTYVNRRFITAYRRAEEAEDFCPGPDTVLITITGNYTAYDLEAFSQNEESVVLIPPMTSFNVVRNGSYDSRITLVATGTNDNYLYDLV